MKKCTIKMVLVLSCMMAMPLLSHAEDLGDSISGLNGVLQKLFDQMLPKCSRMIDVGRAIGGFGALWYIAIRVWKHLARAEAIDFYPLLKPFAIGLAIILFPALIALMNGVLQPIVDATADMSKDSRDAIAWHIQQQEKAVKEAPPAGAYPGDNEDWDKYEQPDGTSDNKGFFAGLKSVFASLNLKNIFFSAFSYVMHVLYSAAALCINTLRTFQLIVLAILGPLVLGISIFDGFQHTLSSWFARYINVYMWLPVANVFGAIISNILENMLTLDQDFASSVAYIVFMIIACVGYTTVPSVAGYIIQAGGSNPMLKKVTDGSATAGGAAVSAAASGMKALL